MEGYFWRITDPDRLGAGSPTLGRWEPAAAGGPVGQATPHTPSFSGSAHHLRVDLGPDARVDLTIDPVSPWPHRALGGSSVFQTVPRLSQY